MRWIGLILLCLSLAGCASVEVANHEESIDRYQNAIAPMLEEWKIVVHDWEKAAGIEKSDPDRAVDAKSAQTRMQNIISSWDSVSPPDKLREYHLWIRHAMDYEKEAFRVMSEYYSLGYEPDPNELRHLRNLATELWVMKDKALQKADDALHK